ncbi:MAG: hypothetical protein JWR50_3535 [Mucilaginibacter sp.]|nr:hypothetical protein [Mucilaginibacter sp.]
MYIDKQDLIALVDKILNKEASDEEIARYNEWFNAFQKDTGETIDNAEAVRSLLLSRIENEISLANDNSSNIRSLVYRIAIAASVILCISVSAFFLLRKTPSKQTSLVTNNDLLPGTNKATLTIGNGNKIILTDAKNGKLAVQGNSAINKTAEGLVVYQPEQKAAEKETVYNTLTTPRGGKYNLVLADGTKVWLDAASSITYPTTFTGTDREVKMTGQVYFEVEHNAAKPFRVMVNHQTVQVLGTHFNINAYDDEPGIKTTLLTGKVLVSKGVESAILMPGQQSIVLSSGNKIFVKTASLEEATAWKDGYFHFESDNIQTVMRQFARWYDVDVQFDGNVPERAISGDIDRNSKASVALRILTLLKVHSKIEGKKIIITP